jgi:hypothetical protein
MKSAPYDQRLARAFVQPLARIGVTVYCAWTLSRVTRAGRGGGGVGRSRTNEKDPSVVVPKFVT